jgi:hypothetical protein
MIKSRKVRWAGHVAHTGLKRNAYHVLHRTATRIVRWAGHVARMGVKRNAYCVLHWTATRKEGTTKTDVGGRILLKWILEK